MKLTQWQATIMPYREFSDMTAETFAEVELRARNAFGLYMR